MAEETPGKPMEDYDALEKAGCQGGRPLLFCRIVGERPRSAGVANLRRGMCVLSRDMPRCQKTSSVVVNCQGWVAAGVACRD